MEPAAAHEGVDVVVVGAGIAGLACALELERRGLAVRVLEREPRVGGRVGSELVDGFRCDRGLMWLDTADPVLRATFDVAALNARPLDRGIVLAHPQGYRVVRGTQTSLVSAIRAGLGEPRDVARLVRWIQPVRRSPRRGGGGAGADVSLAESLRRHGVEGRVREELVRPAARLIFGDDDLSTSYQHVARTLRQLSGAAPALPALGMQALPNQLALELSAPPRLGTPVREVRRGPGGPRVLTDDGPVTARAVVVATEPAAAHGLLGVSSPPMRAVSTWWFAAPEAPTTMTTVLVNPLGAAAGPVSHALVASNVAPRYAAPGRAVIAAACVPEHGREPGAETEEQVRRHLGTLFASPGWASWEPVARYVSHQAWPVVRPARSSPGEVDLGGGVFLAGDHRERPGIAGAAVSGSRAADRVLAHLGVDAEQPAR